jgi:hypothetical protein
VIARFQCILIVFYHDEFRLVNGQEITASTKYKIEAKGNLYKLTLPKVDLTDNGVYEVIVNNGIDTIRTQSKLDVCIKPKVEGKFFVFALHSFLLVLFI